MFRTGKTTTTNLYFLDLSEHRVTVEVSYIFSSEVKLKKLYVFEILADYKLWQ